MSEETIPQMREALDKQAKTISDLEATVAKQQGDLRVRDAREAFRAAGYNPKHGDLFAALNSEGDITAEAVTAFADSQDLPPLATDQAATSEEENSTSVEDDGTDALASLNRGGSRAGDGGSGTSGDQTYTRQEWAEMNRTDPAKAAAVLNQGRVEVSTSGNLRPGQSSVRGSNPYEPQSE